MGAARTTDAPGFAPDGLPPAPLHGRRAAWRISALRLVSLPALVASAALVADGSRPERGFCPFEEACEGARASGLGTIGGIPTATIGLVAFAALFALTFVPLRRARPLLRFAGLLAGLAGATFLLYQGTVLRSFCPLCVVADVAGIVVGLLVIGWHGTPEGEGRGGTGTRLGWAGAACAAVAVPLAWPAPPPEPAWVPVPEVALAQDWDFDSLGTEEPAPLVEPAMAEEAPAGGDSEAVEAVGPTPDVGSLPDDGSTAAEGDEARDPRPALVPEEAEVPAGPPDAEPPASARDEDPAPAPPAVDEPKESEEPEQSEKLPPEPAEPAPVEDLLRPTPPPGVPVRPAPRHPTEPRVEPLAGVEPVPEPRTSSLRSSPPPGVIADVAGPRETAATDDGAEGAEGARVDAAGAAPRAPAPAAETETRPTKVDVPISASTPESTAPPPAPAAVRPRPAEPAPREPATTTFGAGTRAERPAAPPARRAAPAPAAPAPLESVVVEYLNPYCAHCRATEARLDRVSGTLTVKVRRIRVPIWSTDPPPLWAQAWTVAAESGREDAFFTELMREPRETPAAVWTALRRAGLDPSRVSADVARGVGRARLDALRARVFAARITRLPTLDVGRRRLQGEPTEAELREALLAAAARRSSP